MLPPSPLLHTATTSTQQNTQHSSNRKEQHMYALQPTNLPEANTN